MARLFLYSIYDRAAAAYLRPFVSQSDMAASRAFTDVCTDPDHEFGKHPDDYTLMALGIFDERKGIIESMNPTKVINGVEAVAASRQVSKPALKALDDSIKKRKNVNAD